MHNSVFCYYQDRHKKPDIRGLSRTTYQVLLTAWSISWSKRYSVPLLTPVIPASFGHNNSLSLKHSRNLELLLNQFNNANRENSTGSENTFSSKYYDTDKIHNIKTHLKGCVNYIFASLFCKSKQDHLWNKETFQIFKVMMSSNISAWNTKSILPNYLRSNHILVKKYGQLM